MTGVLIRGEIGTQRQTCTRMTVRGRREQTDRHLQAKESLRLPAAGEKTGPDPPPKAFRGSLALPTL